MSIATFPKTHQLPVEPYTPIFQSNEGRRATEDAKDIIRGYEGFHATPFLGPDKIWVIGYAHSRTVRAGMTINKTQAEILLEDDLRLCERMVARLVTVPLTDNQFSALVSFVADIGAHRFADSTLLRLLNRGWYQQVPTMLARWAGGNPDYPRSDRRRAEIQLWSKI